MSFQKIRGDVLITYFLEKDLTSDLSETLARDIHDELEKSPVSGAVIIDFQSFRLEYKALKALAPIGIELRKQQKQLYALAENRYVHATIRQEGLDTVVKPIHNVNQIGVEVPSPKAPTKIDVSFINPFIEGTIHVLEIQCRTKANPLKPLLKRSGEFDCKTDIAGIIGITSKSFTGSIALCFPEKVFLDLMSRMLGEEFTEIGEDLKDGAGELTNMIFGHAKTILNSRGHTIDKALPSVIRAPDLKIDHLGNHDSIILPFSVEEQSFFMEIGTEKI